MTELLKIGDGEVPHLGEFTFETKPEHMNDLCFLHSLLEKREQYLFSVLARITHGVSGSNLYQMWMMEVSELVQTAARAYAERFCSQQFADVIRQNRVDLNETTKDVLSELYRLYMLGSLAGPDAVEWPLMPASFSSYVRSEMRCVSYKLTRDALALCTEAFGLNPSMLHAPIADDWIDYNSKEGLYGEVTDWFPTGRTRA